MKPLEHTSLRGWRPASDSAGTKTGDAQRLTTLGIRCPCHAILQGRLRGCHSAWGVSSRDVSWDCLCEDRRAIVRMEKRATLSGSSR